LLSATQSVRPGPGSSRRSFTSSSGARGATAWRPCASAVAGRSRWPSSGSDRAGHQAWTDAAGEDRSMPEREEPATEGLVGRVAGTIEDTVKDTFKAAAQATARRLEEMPGARVRR